MGYTMQRTEMTVLSSLQVPCVPVHHVHPEHVEFVPLCGVPGCFHSAAGGSHQHSQRPAQPEGNRAGVQLLYPGHSSNLIILPPH